MAGVRETNFNDRPHSMLVLSPSRTVVVYARAPEPEAVEVVAEEVTDEGAEGAPSKAVVEEEVSVAPAEDVPDIGKVQLS